MTRKPNGLTRRRLVQTGAVSLFPMPALAQAPTTLRAGTANAASDIGFFLGVKKGWYREEGIALETTPFRSAADMVAPMGAGQLDIGGGSVSAGIYNAFARGIRLKVVADKASSQPGYGVNKMVVAKKHVDSGRFKWAAGKHPLYTNPDKSYHGLRWGVDLPAARCIDTMAQALAHGLPGSLDKIGQIVGLPVDQFRGIRGCGGCRGNDDGKRFADVTHFFLGKHTLFEAIEFGPRFHAQRNARHGCAEIGGRDHRMHAGHGARSADIERADDAVRVRAAKDCGVQQRHNDGGGTRAQAAAAFAPPSAVVTMAWWTSGCTRCASSMPSIGRPWTT